MLGFKMTSTICAGKYTGHLHIDCRFLLSSVEGVFGMSFAPEKHDGEMLDIFMCWWHVNRGYFLMFDRLLWILFAKQINR